MPYANSVHIIGHLGQDPEVRYTQSGMAIASMSVAVNDRVKKNGEWTDKTSWLTVKCFGKQAEWMADAQKGAAVYAEGRLDEEAWEKDGQRRSKVVILANKVRLLDRQQKPAVQQQSQPSGGIDPNDDIPFAGIRHAYHV